MNLISFYAPNLGLRVTYLCSPSGDSGSRRAREEGFGKLCSESYLWSQDEGATRGRAVDVGDASARRGSAHRVALPAESTHRADGPVAPHVRLSPASLSKSQKCVMFFGVRNELDLLKNSQTRALSLVRGSVCGCVVVRCVLRALSRGRASRRRRADEVLAARARRRGGAGPEQPQRAQRARERCRGEARLSNVSLL